MNLIRKLAWFFKLEKRRYIIGILALSLVSVFNLILKVFESLETKITKTYIVIKFILKL